MIAATEMMVHSSAEVVKDLDRFLVATSKDHRPILIQGEAASGILVAEEDWRAIQETVYLLSIPGMGESIREGLEIPISECSDDPGW